MDFRINLTSHATVLLMLTQKFRQLLGKPDAFEQQGAVTMRGAQFLRIFIDSNVGSRKVITEALDVYESQTFHVLEAVPARWSPIHQFKCNCSTCFTHAFSAQCTCPVGEYGVRPEDQNPTLMRHHYISSSP